jgi:hypothetical protein
MLAGLLRRVVVPMFVAVACGVAATPASANWTTYRADAARSGIDASSGGQVPFSSAWKSPVLEGTVWGAAPGGQRSGIRRH